MGLWSAGLRVRHRAVWRLFHGCACLAVPAGLGVAAGLHELTCGVVVVLDAGGVFQAGDADRSPGSSAARQALTTSPGSIGGDGQAGEVDASALVELGGGHPGAAHLNPYSGSGQFADQRADDRLGCWRATRGDQGRLQREASATSAGPLRGICSRARSSPEEILRRRRAAGHLLVLHTDLGPIVGPPPRWR